jgi:hypothetical protein
VLDTQMRQRTPNLRRMGVIDRAASCWRMEVVAAPIGVEAQRQAMVAEYLQQRLVRTP